jgi:hypothetical protein
MARGGIPLGQWSGSDAVEALHRAIDDHQKISGRQTTHMIRLTYAMLFLTIVMLFGLGIQIWLAWPPLRA